MTVKLSTRGKECTFYAEAQPPLKAVFLITEST